MAGSSIYFFYILLFVSYQRINSLTPGRCSFESVIFEHMD